MLTAAIAALTAAAQLEAPNLFSYNLAGQVLKNDYININYKVVADARAGTVWASGADASGNLLKSYGVRANSKAVVTLNMEFFQWYNNFVTVNLDLFDIIPYAQVVWWSDYANTMKNKQVYGTKGFRSVKLLETSYLW
jgi:hypothetical protein